MLHCGAWARPCACCTQCCSCTAWCHGGCASLHAAPCQSEMRMVQEQESGTRTPAPHVSRDSLEGQRHGKVRLIITYSSSSEGEDGVPERKEPRTRPSLHRRSLSAQRSGPSRSVQRRTPLRVYDPMRYAEEDPEVIKTSLLAPYEDALPLEPYSRLPKEDLALGQDSPGPGFYRPSASKKSGPAFSFGKGGSRPLHIGTMYGLDAPGPGHYFQSDVRKRSGPAHSITGRPQSARTEILPGPGAYEPHRKLTDPSAPAFSIKGKVEKKPAKTPGPGEYGAPDAPKKRPPAFTIGTKVKERESPRPAPNQYNPEKEPRDRPPAFSFGVKVDEKVEELPGPADYGVVEPPAQEVPAYTFGTRPREKIEDRPGPADYYAEASLEKGPAPLITGRPKSPSREPLPGPNYNAHEMGRGPAPIIRPKPQEPKPQKAPGPQDYRPEAWEEHRAPAPLIRPKPADPKAPQIPGPQDYRPEEWEEHRAPAPIIRPKPADPKPPMIPGPQDYRPEEWDERSKLVPSFTIPGRPKEQKADIIPAPGDYATSEAEAKLRSNAPAFSFGTRIIEKIEDRPGPLDYNVEEAERKLQGRGGPAAVIHPRREDKVPETPGPADYRSEDVNTMKNAPAFTMRARLSSVEEELPGPGQYDISSFGDEMRGISIGHRFRQPLFNTHLSITPGPKYLPAYDELGDGAPAFSIGVKLKEREPEKAPGPAEYDASGAALHPSMPAFTFGGRIKEKVPAKTPGPAHYHVDAALDEGPAFTIAGRPKSPEQAEHPGPLSYDVKHATLGAKGPAFSIALPPKPGKAAAIPGPAQYNLNDDALRAGAPAFTFGILPKPQKIEELPGPSHYEHSTAALKPNAPAFSMGLPIKEPPKEGPAPGQHYDPEMEEVRLRRGAPSIVISARPRDPKAPEHPGPGAYNIPETLRRSKGFTMALRPKDGTTTLGDGPGPGKYGAPDSVPGKTPSFSFGTRPNNKESTEAPGPYLGPDDNQTLRRRAPSISFGPPVPKKGENPDGDSREAGKGGVKGAGKGESTNNDEVDLLTIPEEAGMQSTAKRPAGLRRATTVVRREAGLPKTPRTVTKGPAPPRQTLQPRLQEEGKHNVPEEYQSWDKIDEDDGSNTAPRPNGNVASQSPAVNPAQAPAQPVPANVKPLSLANLEEQNRRNPRVPREIEDWLRSVGQHQPGSTSPPVAPYSTHLTAPLGGERGERTLADRPATKRGDEERRDMSDGAKPTVRRQGAMDSEVSASGNARAAQKPPLLQHQGLEETREQSVNASMQRFLQLEQELQEETRGDGPRQQQMPKADKDPSAALLDEWWAGLE